jgi:hypothetical protein
MEKLYTKEEVIRLLDKQIKICFWEASNSLDLEDAELSILNAHYPEEITKTEDK